LLRSWLFEARSQSDPSPKGLTFQTREKAQAHADRMNILRLEFDFDPHWNKEYWKTMPLEWKVSKVE
jgi:hypothetical protein